MPRQDGIEWRDDNELVQVEPIPWEASGTYVECYRCLRQYAREGFGEDGNEISLRALALMRKARVVTCNKAQCEALPQVWDQFPQYGKYLAVPFDPVFLSLDNAGLEKTGGYASGALVERKEALDTQQPGIGLYPFVRDPAGTIRFAGFIPAWIEPERIREISEDDSVVLRAGLGASERVLALLALIDGTAGVVLEPTKTSRQVRRSAERKGRQIALTVVIRASRSGPSRGGRVEYSHRFERRAVYACITRGSKFKQDKLASWCPRHGVRQCRREYRSETVIGPENKPFIPKARKVDESLGKASPISSR